jgi:hypothetical protein
MSSCNIFCGHLFHVGYKDNLADFDKISVWNIIIKTFKSVWDFMYSVSTIDFI